MVADISAPGNYRVSALGCDVLDGRATLYRVIPREGRITIASFSSDRPGPNTRRHAASESEVHGERRCASIDRHSGDAAASIARQGQIARLDRRWINRLVEVDVIRIIARRWWRKCAPNGRDSRSHL